ncbi:MAG: hypothetical protein AB1414_15925 [bacterium]
MNRVLLVGGASSFSIAILHIAIIIGGADWYRFFGAGEKIATLAEQGSWVPGLLTFGISIIFFIWGLYALSGAGKIRRLPFLRLALVIISAIYLARGLCFLPVFFFKPEIIDSLLVWSSLVSFIVGLAYVIGTRQVWLSLSVNNT